MGFLDTTPGKVIGVGAIATSLCLCALGYNAQNQREAEANKTLELTCEQLSQKDVTVKMPDGITYRVICDYDEKVPYLLKRR